MKAKILPNILISVGVLFLLFPSMVNAQAQSGRPGQAGLNPSQDVISRVTKVKGLRLVSTATPPPTDLFCVENFGANCYSPQ